MSLDPQPNEQPWPSPSRAWYALIVLMVVLVLAILDRQIITFLVEPIKSDLKMSDFKLSLLTGFAFIAFYVLVGLPVARVSDSRSRRMIIQVGITIWSLATAACGLAHAGWQLAAARIGVGMGEACNGPASFSMLSDYFQPKKLPKALAVLSMGFYFGSAIANMVGSHVYEIACKLPAVHVPALGQVKPWQLTFILVGLPGLIVAALMSTVSEPPRRELAGGALSPGPQVVPLGQVIGFLFDQRSVYGPIFGGLALRFMLTFGLAFWLPTFFVRTYGWTVGQAGFAIGAVQLTAAPLGLLAGGFLAEWFDQRGHADANMRVNLISTFLIVPTSILLPVMPAPGLAIALLAVNTFVASLTPGPVNAALQTITPNSMRAQFSAIYLVIFNLVGGGLGPSMVAFMTDHIFGSDLSLRYSLALQGAMLTPLACVIFYYGMASYRRRIIALRETGIMTAASQSCP